MNLQQIINRLESRNNPLTKLEQDQILTDLEEEIRKIGTVDLVPFKKAEMYSILATIKLMVLSNQVDRITAELKPYHKSMDKLKIAFRANMKSYLPLCNFWNNFSKSFDNAVRSAGL